MQWKSLKFALFRFLYIVFYCFFFSSFSRIFRLITLYTSLLSLYQPTIRTVVTITNIWLWKTIGIPKSLSFTTGEKWRNYNFCLCFLFIDAFVRRVWSSTTMIGEFEAYSLKSDSWSLFPRKNVREWKNKFWKIATDDRRKLAVLLAMWCPVYGVKQYLFSSNIINASSFFLLTNRILLYKSQAVLLWLLHRVEQYIISSVSRATTFAVMSARTSVFRTGRKYPPLAHTRTRRLRFGCRFQACIRTITKRAHECFIFVVGDENKKLHSYFLCVCTQGDVTSGTTGVVFDKKKKKNKEFMYHIRVLFRVTEFRIQLLWSPKSTRRERIYTRLCIV